MAGIQAIASIASIIGTGVSAVAGASAAQAQAEAQQDALNYQAAQLEARGKQEQAAAQQEALQYKRKKDMALSALQARSAASGFMATDPTATQLSEDIEEYGTLQQQLASFGGRDRRAGIDAQAAASRYQGQIIAQEGRSSAFGTIIGGLTGMAKYAAGLNFPSGGGGTATGAPLNLLEGLGYG